MKFRPIDVRLSIYRKRISPQPSALKKATMMEEPLAKIKRLD
jgi:hypothetical protein